jgi:predicted transcriptional regulator
MKTLHISPEITLPLKFVTSTAAILATRGEGKTHVAKVIAEEMIKAGAHVVIGDPTGVWWGMQSSASGKRAGLPVVVFGGEHADVPITPEMGAAVADAVVNDRINAILDMSGFEDDSDKVRFMLLFGKRLYFINRKALHLFLDEADEFVPQQVEKAPLKAQLLHVFKRIWQRGRVKGIGGTLISQRSAVVNKTLLNLSSTLIALKTVGPTDRDALESWTESYGTEAQQKEFGETIGRMEKYQAWWFSSELGLFKRSKARKLETFDSSATPEVEGDLVVPTAKTVVDLKALGVALTSAVEKVKADDPVELRKRLAEADRKVRELIGSKDALEKKFAEKEGKPVRVEVPIFDAKSRKLLERISKMQESIQADISKAISTSGALLLKSRETAGEVARTMAEIRDNVGRVEAAKRPLMPSRTDMAAVGRMASRVDPEINAYRPRPAGREAAGEANGNGAGGKLPAGAQTAMLKALAQHGEMPVSRLRVLAGITSTETLRTYLNKHRAAGYIEDAGNQIRITRAGLDALGDFEPLPTGAALVSYWTNHLGSGGEGALFAAFMRHPDVSFHLASETQRDHLMQQSGIRSVETLRTYVNKLKVKGLIEKAENGAFMLAQEFASL